MRRAGFIASSINRYFLSASATSVNEGSSVTFSVSTTNVPDGTTLFWSTVSVSGAVNASDFVDNVVSGSVTVNNNSGSILRQIRSDITTEGPETFRIQLRTGSINGPVVAESVNVVINDTSLNPTYSISPNVTSVNEGSSVTFTVSTTGIPNGTTLYWTTSAVQGTINTADFTDSAVSGSFSINNNTASIVRGIRADATTEGTEIFRLQVRTGSTSGTVVATSANVTINDTSTTPVPPPPQPVTTTQTWGPFTNNTHWINGRGDAPRGAIDTQAGTLPDHIQGSFQSTDPTAMRANIMYFPSTIRSALSGATINKVELYLSRKGDSHGQAVGTARIHSHGSAQVLNIWTGTGLTLRKSESFARPEAKWVELPVAVGNGIRDNSIHGLALYTTNTSFAEYVRFIDSSTRLRITYTK